MLIVKGEFFLSFRCQNVGNCFQRITPTAKSSSGMIASSPICGPFKRGCHRNKATIKNHGNHTTSFGAVTRIRQTIIITFSTTIVIVHNGITFGVGIGVSNRDRDIVALVPSSIRGSLNKFSDFIRMGTFIDRTQMKL